MWSLPPSVQTCHHTPQSTVYIQVVTHIKCPWMGNLSCEMLGLLSAVYVLRGCPVLYHHSRIPITEYWILMVPPQALFPGPAPRMHCTCWSSWSIHPVLQAEDFADLHISLWSVGSDPMIDCLWRSCVRQYRKYTHQNRLVTGLLCSIRMRSISAA